MGMSPAPPVANLYVAIHELKHVLTYLKTSLLFYKRFIVDGLGIWIQNNNETIDNSHWKAFTTEVNNGGLASGFSERSQKVDFMDMT